LQALPPIWVLPPARRQSRGRIIQSSQSKDGNFPTIPNTSWVWIKPFSLKEKIDVIE
jgi:hypothetical protein